MTAATNYPAGGSGKETIRMFARCQYIESYYGGYGCYASKFSMGLHPTYDEVRSFTSSGSITPAPTSGGYIGAFAFFLSGWKGMGATIGDIVLDSMSNGFNMVRVVHEGNFPYTARVTTSGVKSTDMQYLELPTSVKYSDADKYFEGRKGGMSATIGFQYGLYEGQVGYITARGNIEYDLRVPSSDSISPPRIVWVKTDEVTLNHTITGK